MRLKKQSINPINITVVYIQNLQAEEVNLMKVVPERIGQYQKEDTEKNINKKWSIAGLIGLLLVSGFINNNWESEQLEPKIFVLQLFFRLLRNLVS